MDSSTDTTIEFILNGQPTRVAPGTTVADLVASTLPNARAYAVELNRTVLSRRDHASRAIAPGDLVEIVTLVGGG
jgi:thiamine biosynthesis protein ThiS